MAIAVGDRLPQASLKVMQEGKPANVELTGLLSGKRVVLFAVPGAFTPTCSVRHLPGFRDRAAEFRAKGVDLIACVAVNDAFVMDAWGKDQNVGGDVLMLADGNADFTRAVGLDQDISGFGMGVRSKRYSMLVEDGVVRQLNVEEGGEFRVSSAEHLIEHL